MNNHIHYSIISFLLYVVALSGCGPSDQFPTAKTSGAVTLNGKPLADAHVWLIPKKTEYLDAKLLVRPQGRTDDEGKFVLTTYLQNDGAPLGDFSAIVLHGENDPDAAVEEQDPKSPRAPKVPMKYKDAKTSGLDVNIKSGENNVVLELKTK